VADFPESTQILEKVSKIPGIFCVALAAGVQGGGDGGAHLAPEEQHRRERHERRENRQAQGGAVQVELIKLTLQAPGTKRLKLNYDRLLSILLQFCFQFEVVPLHQGRQGRDGVDTKHVRGGGVDGDVPQGDVRVLQAPAPQQQ